MQSPCSTFTSITWLFIATAMTTFLVLISVFYFIPTGIVILWAPTQIGAGICSILFLSEIIVGAISSSILTDEPFGWRQITGCSLIVIGGIVAVNSIEIIFNDIFNWDLSTFYIFLYFINWLIFKHQSLSSFFNTLQNHFFHFS